MPDFRNVQEYVELAEAERAVAGTDPQPGSAPTHVARAHVYATLALARATFDRP